MAQFVFQDPEDQQAVYLVEALLAACVGATRGGGAFAFASAAGVRLLLTDETFVEFASSNSFQLIVGVDAITSKETLNIITGLTQQTPGLNARVFLHDREDSIFHPNSAGSAHREAVR